MNINVPEMVKESLSKQNENGWDCNNFVVYMPMYPPKGGDKFIKYHQLENGEIVIEKTL